MPYGEPLFFTLLKAIGTVGWSTARLVEAADPIAAFVWDLVGEVAS